MKTSDKKTAMTGTDKYKKREERWEVNMDTGGRENWSNEGKLRSYLLGAKKNKKKSAS